MQPSSKVVGIRVSTSIITGLLPGSRFHLRYAHNKSRFRQRRWISYQQPKTFGTILFPVLLTLLDRDDNGRCRHEPSIPLISLGLRLNHCHIAVNTDFCFETSLSDSHLFLQLYFSWACMQNPLRDFSSAIPTVIPLAATKKLN